jgi:phage gp29-like protein
MDPHAHWQPDPEVVTQVVEGETVLVHLQTNEIYALNATATRAWDLLVSGMNRESVQEALQREFDVAPEELRSEIDSLIEELVEKKLLQPAGA